ncbi:fumarylacetoacetate hydrolase family protein [Desulfofustis limnaeus]|jgi:2-keto-4-pentenoate hydratase/2-oxohepta-3-ene-1,7-dioic acid hydratase in catechol pathway|uniref:Acylpyruvase n=1 Tax=Desulfofustis limnaeus TaxID=2740163 RepID=A0ABM7WEC5_9BACT|nr:fumarylacetoacetate hydrolase family protein [Desulfofustis limnaeus]MDX9896308.1 fumarylacetoacetate hydrolase family protein [Desulfofustis sp.]BDD89334.1 acylpyruvase [Desulfofustis limnaeus]
MSVRLPVSDGSEYLLNPQKIICLGLNYRDHITESAQADGDRFKDETPAEPILFAKTPNTLIGPDQAIVLPALLDSYGFRTCRTDYEAELALIVGKDGKNIPESKVYDHVFGYTCFNDISQRNFQKHDKSGWFRGKSLDTFGPIGPRIVRREDMGDPQNLDIVCRLNGKVVQSGNTSQMIFSIPAMVAFISRHFTLKSGDIIVTGTPSGVGPIAPGDVVEVEISGIGVLRNQVMAEGR